VKMITDLHSGVRRMIVIVGVVMVGVSGCATTGDSTAQAERPGVDTPKAKVSRESPWRYRLGRETHTFPMRKKQARLYCNQHDKKATSTS
jgi:hypothetical protein